MRVLIAEDDLTSRLLLKKVLEKWGYEVVVTTNGAEAWGAAPNDDSPRLVVLDWMMPEMDGVEVCRRVRALDTHQPPYIILLTALGEQDHVIAGLGAGADDYVGKPYDPAELRARVEVGRRLVELNAELIAAQLRFEEQAHTDALTGLLNRGAIVERLEIEFERADREGGEIGIGMADIDHFKRVNDTHGHAAGDAVLRELAGRMESALRPYDSLGRFGGEEFLILVPGAPATRSSPRSLSACAPRSRRRLWRSRARWSSASAWAASREGEAVDALIARADEALYAAKARGRDLVVLAER